MNPQLDTSNDPFGFAVKQAESSLQNPLFGYAASNIGKKIVGFGEKYDSFINEIFSSQYRFYFDVDNTYVLKKIIMTLAPFLYRGEWNSSHDYQPKSPTENVHAPDLYLPLMSMVTFVLLRCLSIGINGQNKFDPSYIVSSFWKCFVVSLLEVIIVKIVFCFIDGIRASIFDVVSHLNYRYCTLCALMLLNILTNNVFSFIGTIYILLCQSIFVYKTLKRYNAQNNSSALELSSFSSNITLLLSLIQPFFSWILLTFGQ